ncbi:alpha-amylase [Aquimarina agarilytica]|uniref:alpha-amylase n=1 Tax=Aquimarina agarilytica TaxID=1087449 RepID=UPI000287B017|nr:alpha-amylase [Aquimarina agarilytica]
MENVNKYIVLGKAVLGVFAMAFLCYSCEEVEQVADPGLLSEQEDLRLDLKQYDNGSRVMMQAFYWDVEPIGEWYTVINSKLADWSSSGVDRIWLPPVSKGQSGMFSMGYDPSDYFDLGEFDQHGTVETRFGSRVELENLINQAHDNDIEVIADVVLGHNSGGGKQDNPFRPGDTEVFSLFNEANGNASGKFNRTNEHFHPNDIHENDEQALFFEKTDLCHDQVYVQDWLWKRDDSVAEYYKKIGFDGWRFDYVKSFSPNVVKQWNAKVGGFSVGENFDGNAEVLKKWVDESGSPAFDFACFYKLEEALDRFNDLTYLEGDMLRKIYPDKAVTFVANHDTEKDKNVNNKISFSNKMLAYAYMLTHDGYPTIFYSDYENLTFQKTLKNLMEIHSTLATGPIEVLKLDQEEYIMQREGSANNPGLILYMNIGRRAKSVEVQSNWLNKNIIDYTGNMDKVLQTEAMGKVLLEVPAKSFAIWSIAK